MTNNYNKYVLTNEILKKYLSKSNFLQFENIKNKHLPLSENLANRLAVAIKKWAQDNGAVAYSHWFMPLTGKSAEKQVMFSNGNMDNFCGKCLILGETDASSFPSGGERETFEARGYTIWDYYSPIFIDNLSDGYKVLKIPCTFCSYNGVALDEKSSLLRALDSLETQVERLLSHFDIDSGGGVICNVGLEQEFFLINKQIAQSRPDICATGRALFGKPIYSDQSKKQHYFERLDGSLSGFLQELVGTLLQMGINVKILHNEVAPCQHEIVPEFASANVSADQNIILMEKLKEVAEKHGYFALLSEKPFDGYNGSGKHNNWSVSTKSGINLFDPQTTNTSVFMLIFSALIAAIDKNYALLRLSASSYTNDFRLGGYEAPPSIISVYIGNYLLQKIENYCGVNLFGEDLTKNGADNQTGQKFPLNNYRDVADRNRTSPFAFCGSKFEFRMVGSTQNVSFVNTVLATTLASELKIINHLLDNCNDKISASKNIVKNNFEKHGRIVYNGNCYDKKWSEIAKSRGLVDYTNFVDASQSLLEDGGKVLLTDNIMTSAEINVRYVTGLQNYVISAVYDAKIMVNMCKMQILPSFDQIFVQKSEIICKMQSQNYDISQENEYILKLIDTKNNILGTIKQIEKVFEKIEKTICPLDKAKCVLTKLLPLMKKLKGLYDNFEPNIPRQYLPFVSIDDIVNFR